MTKGYWYQRTCESCGEKYWGNAQAPMQFVICRPCLNTWKAAWGACQK